MAAPKPQPRAGSEDDIRAAQNYFDSVMASDDDMSAEEIDSIRDSVEAIRRGTMSLAEFEQKYDL